MKAELERRVHDLLDAGRIPLDDPEVLRVTRDDPSARAEVAALARTDRWLRDWSVPLPEADFDAIAQRIEQRLDEPMRSLDATAPPVFDDPDARVRPFADRSASRSGEYTLESLAGAVPARARARAQVTGSSPAVALGTRPERPAQGSRPSAGPWLAGAAVALLAAIGGVMTLQSAEEAPQMASVESARETRSSLAEPSLPPIPAEAPAQLAPGSRSAPEDDWADEAPEEEVAEQEMRGRRAPAAAPVAVDGRTEGAPRAAARSVTMAAAGSGAPAAAEAPAPAPALEATAGADRAGVDPAIQRTRAAVRTCLGGVASAVVMVDFVDGAVRRARVVQPTVGAPVHDCVTRAIRSSALRPEQDQASRTLYYRWGSPVD